ncbi:MAG: hypothetical protein OEW24_02645 [Chloroflexota bacterium]|nr:hypothetical protein [Chloroflexota bacterium]
MFAAGPGSVRRWALPLVSLLLVAACRVETSSTASASPSGTVASPALPSPTEATEATEVPSTPTFPAVELPPDSLVVLSAGASFHVVPSEPAILTLDPGSEVIVAGGPREIGGETWYEVRYPAQPPHQFGWARLSDPNAVALVEGDCPTDPQAAMGMLAWDRLQCYADASLTVTGEVGHCQGGVVPAEPAWLAYACWVISDGIGGGLDLHTNPDGGIVFPDNRVRARVTGHFNDPASTTCRYTEDADPAWLAPSADEQILLCREAFVVDIFEVLEDLGPQEG